MPNALSQPGGYALGAQAGEAAIRRVVSDAGFTRFRRVAETPFNLVYEARPGSGPTRSPTRWRRVFEMRARMPEASGTVRSRGVAIAYEVFGTTGPWVVFAPIDPIIHSHGWKAQVSYLSRYGRVVTIDAPGNGRSERTLDPAAYGDEAMADHLLAVMDQPAHRPGRPGRHLHAAPGR